MKTKDPAIFKTIGSVAMKMADKEIIVEFTYLRVCIQLSIFGADLCISYNCHA